MISLELIKGQNNYSNKITPQQIDTNKKQKEEIFFKINLISVGLFNWIYNKNQIKKIKNQIKGNKRSNNYSKTFII